MNKNIKELKELAEDENGFKMLRLQDFTLYYLIPVLEDFENRLETIEAELGIYTDEEIKEVKIGGTDPE